MASPAALVTSAHGGWREALGSSFSELDELVQAADGRGLIRVTSDVRNHAPLARHLGRRAAQIGRICWVVADSEVAEPWRELAKRLGVSPGEPLDTAAGIAEAAQGAVVVVARSTPSRWGELVQDEVTRLAAEDEAALLLVVLQPASLQRRPQLSARKVGGSTPGAGSTLDLELDLHGLSAADGQRWWAAVIAQDSFARQDRFQDLAALDGWWEATRRLPMVEPTTLPPLDESARELLAQLVDARQALSGDQLAALDQTGARAALSAAGLVHVDERGDISARDGLGLAPPTGEPRRRLADALRKASPADGWALMRAAEILAELGEQQQAEEVAFAALHAMTDATAREDVWVRWDGMFAADACDPAARLERLVRAADQALVIGDCDRAGRMAGEAMTLNGERFDVLLLHGRASLARGDTTTAALSLSRAMAAAEEPGDRATAGALMGQVRLASGDPEQAKRYALEAANDAADVATRLEARNVLGKLLFAVEEWSEAETHFAADAYEAARAGLAEAELRARLNRAIAVLYTGNRERAREMLEEVMREGERLGIDRAVAYTLANLATLAILQHEYEHALALSERAIEVCRRVEPRASMVQPITNLAELRLRLGLVDEAEHGLRFGLNACGPNLPLSRYAYFAKVAACIHLERGDTALAVKELGNAVSGATCAHDLPVLAQCHRIAARIALEDGDLTRARVALTQAAELKHSAFGQAELAVLKARVARMAGEPYAPVAREALAVAQRADDPESMRDAHLLLHHSHQVAGEIEAARSHLRAALAERDRVADYLRPSLRQRYLGRASLAELRELEQRDESFDLAAPDRSGLDLAMPGRVAMGPGTEPHRSANKATQQRLLIGDSAPMRTLRGTIKRVAATDATVLISGQTGTGKELVAEAIHRDSARRNGPLVKVNCAALVETLLLSELFGHEKGAFTGASSRRRGRFELADGGTLFLDEIGDISPRTQVALLRVLQDGTFERVGGCSQLKTDVRIVCATHRDLKAMVERGEFREDLYYRLCGVVLEVPALRERLSDLPVLAEALLRRASEQGGVVVKPLSADAVAGLSRHGWPGNVRELENALRVAALFSRGDHIELADFVDNVEGLRYLDEPVVGPDRRSVPPASDSGERLTESLPPPSSSTELVYAEIRGGTNLAEMKRRLEQECIARALVESAGNITQAAKLLGMKRPRLSQLVKQYKLASVLEDIKS